MTMIMGMGHVELRVKRLVEHEHFDGRVQLLS